MHITKGEEKYRSGSENKEEKESERERESEWGETTIREYFFLFFCPFPCLFVGVSRFHFCLFFSFSERNQIDLSVNNVCMRKRSLAIMVKWFFLKYTKNSRDSTSLVEIHILSILSDKLAMTDRLDAEKCTDFDRIFQKNELNCVNVGWMREMEREETANETEWSFNLKQLLCALQLMFHLQYDDSYYFVQL